MKKLVLALLLSISGFLCNGRTVGFGNESLNYRVTYKWGLIHKNAGRANLTINHIGNEYHVVLTARSDPWADRIYSVRDTLSGIINADDMSPLKYVKRTHEKGKFGHDEITYQYSAGMVRAFCTRFRQNKKGETSSSELELTSTPPAVDMLSVYYYIRGLDYTDMSVGHMTEVTVFSGKRKENLTLTYMGKEMVRLNETDYDCYKVAFSFTQDGRTKSSDSMTAWLRVDGTHIPIKVIGQLPVGKIHVLWLGEQ